MKTKLESLLESEGLWKGLVKSWSDSVDFWTKVAAGEHVQRQREHIEHLEKALERARIGLDTLVERQREAQAHLPRVKNELENAIESFEYTRREISLEKIRLGL